MKNKRGITLISLVITIIVLLILAGITISGIVGNDGILNQSQNAKTKTDLAKEQELRDLTMGEAMTNLELTFYQDGGNKVPIPAGFAVSQVEGENKVEDGLVIIDSDGNEFVWIPCGNEGTYEAAANYSKKSTTEGGKEWISYAYDSDVEGRSGNQYKGKTGWKNPEDQITAAKLSIQNYGGFYVARYEAGVPSDAPFHISKTSGDNYVGVNNKNKVSTEGSINARGADSEIADVKDLKPVSKRGVQAWNFISQTNAVTVSENMYKDNSDVDSFLIDSNAWNYICGDIFGDTKRLGEEGIKKSSTYGNYYDNTTTDYTSLDCLWANHTNSRSWSYATKYGNGNITTEAPRGTGNSRLELATGASNDFKVYNIYDMAGNLWEWTAEFVTVSSTTYAAIRGGSFVDGGSNYPVVRVGGDNTTDHYNMNVGFRPVLYVK